jgi:L-aminopeptidase/D-esterase-like protein
VSEPAEPLPMPAGFRVGHWTDREAETGCTVIVPPPDTRCGVEIRGGGPGTRETEIIAPLANPEEASAVLLTGGSAHGLAAADGVMSWCEEQGLGYATPGGLVPLVPAAVIYDLVAGRGDVRPGPEQGRAACEAAVAKLRGREHATPGGVGYAAARLGSGETVAALAAVNATGDILAEDGGALACASDDDGRPLRAAELVAELSGPPTWAAEGDRQSTTLVCLMTDATLEKTGCAKVARMASAGIARAVDPVFTPHDGDVVFCLASGRAGAPPWSVMPAGTLAATVTAAAIRDAIRSANPGIG